MHFGEGTGLRFTVRLLYYDVQAAAVSEVAAFDLSKGLGYSGGRSLF